MAGWVPLVVGAWLCGSCLYLLWDRGAGAVDWIALAVIGLAGVIAARYTLGRSFSMRRKRGRWSRRGFILGFAILFTFQAKFLNWVAIMLWNPILTVIVVAVIPLQLWRQREAKVLEESLARNIETIGGKHGLVSRFAVRE